MKGVAIGYIIAIVLGIVVIALIGYWMFKSTGQIGGSATVHDCKQRQLTLCTQWAQSGFAGVDDDTTAPDNTNLPGYTKWNTECSSIITRITRGLCKQLLGMS